MGAPSSDLAEEKDRLRIGHGPWGYPLKDVPWSHGRDSFKTDILIVGAGITGSLLAQHLAAHGRSVTLVDRLRPGEGSTAASTAMLQWEIDTGLAELADLYGFAKAAALYRQSFAAVEGLGQLVAHLGIPCGFTPRAALLLAAAGGNEARVAAEHKARAGAELPGLFLDRAELRRRHGIDRPAAIDSPGAAEADPLCLSQYMLLDALKHGARLVHDEVLAYDFDTRAARVALACGTEIEASTLILATGYTMPPFVPHAVARRSASWAAVTPAGTDLSFWSGRALIWEDDTPYLYARTTADGRILVGGEDERIDDAAARDAVAPQKAAAMHAKLQALWHVALPPFETTWSAAFSETDDGLPLIGPVPGVPRCYAAYGYGGNGITYSFLASRMIGAMLAGEPRPWFDDFALDRPAP